MGLVDFLLHERTADNRTPMTLKGQLERPWGWPVDPALRERAEGLATEPAPSPRLGVTLVVSVNPGGLWELDPARRPGERVEFQGTAAASARLARRLVTRDLPLYADIASLHHPPDWSAVPFAIPVAASRALEGESFGLGFALATASLLTGIPVPHDIVSSAALLADGSLQPVDGLREKIELVLEDAPGVTRFLVAALQEDEARRVVEDWMRRLEPGNGKSWLAIVPVGTFRDAFAAAFPDATARMEARWTEPGVAPRLVEELFRTCVYGTPMVLGWKAIAACAQSLSPLEATKGQAWEVSLVHAIASRHAGESPTPPKWPLDEDLDSMQRYLRLRLVAQLVQASADGEDDPAVAARRARPHVRQELKDCSAEDLILLGAIARALAASGADAEAIEMLEGVLQPWRDVGAEHESSYALCELLRLHGIAGHTGRVAELCRGPVASFELLPQASEASLGHVRVAAGRALVQVGRHGDALEYLRNDGRWPPLPRHAEGARDRWLARALDALGSPGDASDLRRGLESRSSHGEGLAEQAILSRLDEAIRTGQPTGSLMIRLAQLAEPRRLLKRCPPGADPAHFAAENYRY